MERVIKKDKYGNIACNDIIIYSSSIANLKRNIKDFSSSNWKVIEPKYFRYRDDNSMLELWYDRKGIMLSGNIEGYIGESFTTELIEKITYEEVMYSLDKEQRKILGYNNKDLMSKIEDELEDEASKLKFDITKLIEESNENDCYEIKTQESKQNNNGNTSDFTPDYYGARCKCGEKIDAYAVCDKYQKPHKGSAWHHAVKKLIRAGDGHKNLSKDIDEVIDSLKRWKEQIDSQAIEGEQ